MIDLVVLIKAAMRRGVREGAFAVSHSAFCVRYSFSSLQAWDLTGNSTKPIFVRESEVWRAEERSRRGRRGLRILGWFALDSVRLRGYIKFNWCNRLIGARESTQEGVRQGAYQFRVRRHRTHRFGRGSPSSSQLGCGDNKESIRWLTLLDCSGLVQVFLNVS